MQQTIKTYLESEHSILLSVTYTLYVYQVCHGVGRCVKDGSCFLSSLEWKWMNSINGIPQQILDAIKHITDDIFSFRKTAHWCTCTVHATQSKLLRRSRLPFSWTKSPTAPSWTHWLQDLGSHRTAWVWVVSQKYWRNHGATGWILAMHWYSIWVKNAIFVFPVLTGSAEAQVIWGGTVKRLSIAYFIGNITAKNIKMRSRVSKL